MQSGCSKALAKQPPHSSKSLVAIQPPHESFVAIQPPQSTAVFWQSSFHTQQKSFTWLSSHHMKAAHCGRACHFSHFFIFF
jgi:hypothetical protein